MKRFQVMIDADLQPILPRYFEIRWEELRQMEEAAGKGDGEMLRTLGHRLKGTGSSYGFRRLTELGAAIEDAGQAVDIKGAAGLIAEVRQYLEHVDIIFGSQD
ncbi:Hpt domain-containing protein [Pseudodesulfovibrio piezophilus]|uniref:Hpt protein n=1 Tax=Pseudodesulfovibrio piezophilus (strain DSM 21447 / JCM 15486 / C1TLV30) TaxID=1322246 RepID=M1WRU5_PSEP2|nr:Hpt domain-containing protein [Pseudodesulfovibrio piezophilus]CCH49774.1 Hpt protein [Pseudodesulfovibrio piezophilus C1TLV30]